MKLVSLLGLFIGLAIMGGSGVAVAISALFLMVLPSAYHLITRS